MRSAKVVPAKATVKHTRFPISGLEVGLTENIPSKIATPAFRHGRLYTRTDL